jgi:chorismate mutase
LGSLAALREQIDAIDAELLALIDRRAALARDIAAAKARETAPSKSPSLIRPDREALLLRRLLASPRLAASDAVIVHIWRELIGESLRIQCEGEGGLVLQLAAAEKAGELMAWTRGRFGAAPTIIVKDKPQDIIIAARDPRHVGVISLEAKLGPWWGRLLLEPEVRIMAALPELGYDKPQALAVAAIKPEPTGDDLTFFVTDWPGSEADLIARIADQGLVCEALSHLQGLWLMTLSGFVQEDDARLKDRFGTLSGIIGAAPRL